jgi:hypothetical protein
VEFSIKSPEVEKCSRLQLPRSASVQVKFSFVKWVRIEELQELVVVIKECGNNRTIVDYESFCLGVNQHLTIFPF